MSRPPANRHARRSARVRRRRTRALATTGAVGLLLPVATTTSLADTYDESIDGELPGTFGGRLVLDPTVDSATGSVQPGDADFFSFEGIANGTLFDAVFEPVKLSYGGGTRRGVRARENGGGTRCHDVFDVV